MLVAQIQLKYSIRFVVFRQQAFFDILDDFRYDFRTFMAERGNIVASVQEVLRERRRLKKEVLEKNPGVMPLWIGGVLYNRAGDWPPEPIADVPKMPKPGQEAEGYGALNKRFTTGHEPPRPKFGYSISEGSLRFRW